MIDTGSESESALREGPSERASEFASGAKLGPES